MALFKFRKGRDEQPAPPKKAPTVEAVRRRAMHRLIGAAVLVLAGVIGFPLIFDNQPRPIPVDLPIEIVDKAKVKPLVPPQPATPEVVIAAPPKEAAPIKEAAPASAKPPVVAAPEPTPTPAPAAVATAKAPAPAATTTQPPDTRSLDAKKARALLEARPLPAEAATTPSKVAVAAAKSVTDGAKLPAAASDARFVVQVGAFADASKVRDVRRKVEATGLKTYTQVVATAEGDRTRVRVGPFADRSEADKAAEKIRKLNLSAAILTL